MKVSQLLVRHFRSNMDRFRKRLEQIYLLVHQFCLHEFPNGAYSSRMTAFIDDLHRLHGGEISLNMNDNVCHTKMQASEFLEINIMDLLSFARNERRQDILDTFDRHEWRDMLGLGVNVQAPSMSPTGSDDASNANFGSSDTMQSSSPSFCHCNK